MRQNGPPPHPRCEVQEVHLAFWGFGPSQGRIVKSNDHLTYWLSDNWGQGTVMVHFIGNEAAKSLAQGHTARKWRI